MHLNPHARTWTIAAALTVGCGDDGRASSDGPTTSVAGTDTTVTPTTTETPTEPTTDVTTSISGGMTDATSTADPTISTTNGSSSSGDPTNQPPAWDSEPGTQIVITEIFKTNFQPGQIFISSSVTDEIRVYDKESLNFLMAFTHPAFSEVNSPSLVYGPNGAAFNVRGNLVVAGYAKFVEFSDYGVEFKTYPKQSEESNENLVFDSKGNMYTTTATGGSDKLNQYAAADYAFVQTIEVPPGAGQLTGITFDGYGRLYVASQADNLIHFTDFNVNLETFTWFKTLPGEGNVKSLEGLQFNSTGELVAAAGDLVRYDVNNQTKLGVFDEPGDEFPVPLRVDNEGNIYTADYENGSGTAPADVIKFSPDGQFLTKKNDAGLFGPFGLAISGTVLAGDPPVAWQYVLMATDPDGDPLTYALIQGPPDMYLDNNTHTLHWAVTSEDIGDYDIILEVSDGQGGVTEQKFTLTVSAG
jgi:sugar lactone lactonase YvrE